MSLTNKRNLERKAIQEISENIRKGETASFGDQSPEANKYITDEELYVQKCKDSFPYFQNMQSL